MLLGSVLARGNILDPLPMPPEYPLEQEISTRVCVGERGERILGHGAAHEHRTILSEEADHALVAVIDRALRLECQRHQVSPQARFPNSFPLTSSPRALSTLARLG